MTLSITRTFDSFEEFNSFPHGWHADFRVTSSDPYVATIEHTAMKAVLINTASYSQPTLQRASTPAGMRTLALPVQIHGPMSWFNYDIDDRSLMLFPENRELFSVSSGPMHIATFSIADDLFERQLEQEAVAEPSALPNGQVRQVDESTWRHLHKCLFILREYCEKYRDEQAFPELERYLSEEAAYHFTSVMLGRPLDSYRLPVHAAAKNTRRAMQYILSRLRTPLTVAEVCAAVGVGRRNLEISFQRYLGSSPKQVITQMRYSFCREDLLLQRWGNVKETAHAWGFWHMGQFAANYKSLFGESPSETVRRLKAPH